jgi:hypothetical protein
MTENTNEQNTPSPTSAGVPGTLCDIFEAMHRGMFDQLFSLDEQGREAKAKILREAGVAEEMIADLTRPGIQVGMSFGGAKTVDVQTLVERVLFRQNAGHVLLRIKRPPFDEAGHVEIEVLEVGPPSEEALQDEP